MPPCVCCGRCVASTVFEENDVVGDLLRRAGDEEVERDENAVVALALLAPLKLSGVDLQFQLVGALERVCVPQQDLPVVSDHTQRDAGAIGVP